jgi:cephalosporin-C deacetylase-like acetyl esterase
MKAVAMRIASAAAALLVASFPAALRAQNQPVHGPAPVRSPVAPLNKPEANAPDQAGRNALYSYLDDIAAKDEAARHETVAKITTRAEAEARQREVRAKILALLGGLPAKTPLNPRTTGETHVDAGPLGGGFRIVKVMYDSQPNFPVTALLYLPDSGSLAASGKLPAIIIAPGHGATGKVGDYQSAAPFARNGFAVLSYDPIGQGERIQYLDPAHPEVDLATRSTGEHAEAGLQPTLIGDAVARYFAWDGMRAVDYLLSRPEIDANRIGAYGCSGGGAMTALLGGVDPRVHAVATACYFTSFDTLLPSIGAQDAEQSIPGFLASGLSFPDWIEAYAPRPYAMVGTVSDMFPWAGFLKTATEARRFYSLFDPSAEGTRTGNPLPPTPTGPTLNPDTSNVIAPSAPFQLITGIGGHGNLRPIQSQIVSFFLQHLANSDAKAIVPPPPAPGARPAFGAPTEVPASALQVTPTGQVLTSYPGSETIYSLNLKRAAQKLPKLPASMPLAKLQAEVREVTHAEAKASDATMNAPGGGEDAEHILHRLKLTTARGIEIEAEFYRPADDKKHPALLVLRDNIDPSRDAQRAAEMERFRSMAKAGTAVLVIAPRPSPPGGEETKSPILGPFYLTELRAELVDKTILGMRVDDVVRSVTFLSNGTTVDPNNITAEASGHMGLVLLHAAVLDPRIKHITIDHVLESYESLLHAPMPLDAPQDILPGVLMHYDIPELVHALGPRLTATDWLPGTADLSAASKIQTPAH